MIVVVTENKKTHKQTILARLEDDQLPEAKDLLESFLRNNKGYKGAVFIIMDNKLKRIAKAKQSLFGKVSVM
jgi:hypothetical protein